MTFQPGNNANPRGRPKRGTAWADVLRHEAKQIDPATGRRKLQLVAEKVLELAIAGDVGALKELGNRLDGKAASQHEHSHVLSIGDEVLMALRELANRPREMKVIDNEDPDSA